MVKTKEAPHERIVVLPVFTPLAARRILCITNPVLCFHNHSPVVENPLRFDSFCLSVQALIRIAGHGTGVFKT
jgi:hypothetical protein